MEFQEVSKHYSEIKALDKITFGLKKGDFVSLVGPSGAGKSTVIKLLIREELPSSGKIIVAGRDIARFNQRTLSLYRRKIGVVFQDYKLLPHKTVYENIAFALEVCDATNDEITERVPKILNLVGLADRAQSYPKELSGGERQRAAIARALIHSPKILIADEPTGNLDPANAKEVIDLLMRINRTGALVLLATHNAQMVNALQRRVIKVERGKIQTDAEKGKYL
ncbi:MAG: cell division transport system ATP-binding protein [Candidatus Berkelbacteria bacterium Licking1014_7]|uniref:Cell division ATP-binding protein FtsE n=1 Tax=Candidatus Berkelbacteria bacterium Licking1014_7 TaxID=2017147 RepID=A0A554LKC5_9BACT|nr:MAG: cell division transport system ATP-binding protein [Candidatus Berkelbacteria bacterium Licking1014_7]